MNHGQDATPGQRVVVKAAGRKTARRAVLVAAESVALASYIAFLTVPPGRRVALWVGWTVLVACWLAWSATGKVTVDDVGVTVSGWTPWGPKKRHAWRDFVRAEVHPGRAVVLHRPSATPRRPKSVVVGARTGRRGVERLAAAAADHVRVTRAAPERWVWRLERIATASFLVVVLVYQYLLVPYGHRVALSPGTALDIEQRVLAPAGQRHRSPGTILSLSVSERTATLSDILGTLGDHSWQVLSLRDAFGHQSRADADAQAVADNRLAKSTAVYLALTRLGQHLAVTGGAPQITYSPPGSPLHPGDLVTAINGIATAYQEDIRALLRGGPVGEAVEVTVVDPVGATSRRSVRLSAARYVRSERSLGGAMITSTPLRLDPPPAVTVDTAGEGGPSAGLAMTLGLLDALGPAPILGAERVAVTGTVAPDGTVGSIGGLQQKVALAERSRASLLIVPCDEQALGERFASPGLAVVGVATLDQALAALAGSPPSCAGTG